MSESYDPDADILPDELIDRHFGSPAAVADPDPEADEAAEPEEDADLETSDEEPEDDDDLEDDDDEAGEEDPDELDEDLDDDDDEEDNEEEEDDEETSDEEPEDVLDRVTPEDRERIEEDPALKKLHRQMRADYTRKTQAVAERSREIDRKEQSIREFEGALATREGMAAHIARTFDSNPEVIGDAFEIAATKGDPMGFLVEVGLHDPEVFEKAYERVQELQHDETEKNSYVRDRDQRTKEKKLEQREHRLRRNAFDRDWSALEKRAAKEAAKLGIEKDDVPEVVDRLKAQVRGKIRDDGSIALSGRDVRAAAKDAKAALDKVYSRVKRKLSLRQEAESRKSTKRKAAGAAKPARVAPKGVARKRPKEKVAWKPPENADPLDAFVDHRLSE